MPRPPQPLPVQLPEVFSVADAKAFGVRHERLQHEDVLRLAPGVYARLDTGTASTGPTLNTGMQAHPAMYWRESQRTRAQLLGRTLSHGQFFSHHTAAALWGLPILPRHDSRLDIGYLHPDRGSRSQLIRTHRIMPGSLEVVALNGIPVLSPASTWVALAGELGRTQAIALGDAVIHIPRMPGTTRRLREPFATPDEIERLLAMPFRRDRTRLTQYLELLSSHAASPPESHLRIRLHDWGFPVPTLDYDVRNSLGKLLGCSEFAFPEHRLALEYEGDHHRTETTQWERDIEKYRDYANAGWEVLRVTRKLLYREPAALHHQLSVALARRGVPVPAPLGFN